MKGDVLLYSTKRKMKKKVLCLSLIISLILPCLFSIISHAADDVTFSISKMNADKGDTIIVIVNMNCTNSFAAANFELTYDASVLEYSPYMDENNQITYKPNCGEMILSGGEPIATIAINSATSGKLKIGYMSQASVAGKNGEFLKFRFNVKNNASYGDSSISMTTTTLKNANGDNLSNTITPGTVSIISGLTINNSTLQMVSGNQSTLSVSPTNGSIFDTVTWNSSNSTVASVIANSDSKSAKVTANSVGTATITATLGSATITCTVTVAAPESQYNLTIKHGWSFLPATQIRTLTVEFDPTSAGVGKTITWSSSDDSVATIDSSGKVTAVANGEVTITASDGTVPATFTFNVEGLLGNIGDDSKVTSYDAYKALDLSTDKGSGTPYRDDEAVVLDVNRDNDITSEDAYKILKYSVGLITSF